MTSGSKCLKNNIIPSVSMSKFPQCLQCAFLKQTLFLTVSGWRWFGIWGHFFPVFFYTYFFLKVRVRQYLTISGPDTISNVCCIFHTETLIQLFSL